MVPGVSVAAEVDEPHVPAAVRQQEAEAGPAAAQHEVGGGRLVAVQVEDGRGGLGAGPGRYPVTVCITFPDTDRCAGVQGCRGAGTCVCRGCSHPPWSRGGSRPRSPRSG